jgi:hypothetical protein
MERSSAGFLQTAEHLLKASTHVTIAFIGNFIKVSYDCQGMPSFFFLQKKVKSVNY